MWQGLTKGDYMKITMNSFFQAEKLSNGYYIVKTLEGKKLMNKEWNTITFETKKRAIFFINTITAIQRDNGKIPYNMMF